MASAAGDALVALALADSVFFSIKPNAAMAHVALYLGGAQSLLGLAAGTFTVCAFLNLRLPQPRPAPPAEGATDRRGRIPALALPAIGTAGLRGAIGFLITLLAFSLLRSGEPKYWFG